jgi:hypothetical protein
MALLSPRNLYDYQRQAIMHQLEHESSMLWLEMGLGKEQPNNEPVLTPRGWVAIGALVPGDHVVGLDGEPTEVLSVHPQGVKDVLKITFSDGSWTRCGWDHLWKVTTGNDMHKGRPWKVLTTRELVDRGLSTGGNSRWIIPLTKTISYPEKNLPIDPYLLGALLGDGHLSEKGGVTICTDIAILDRCGIPLRKIHETSPYTGYGYVRGVKQSLRDLHLMGKRSWEKFVPEIYRRAASHQRYALLQGLLDTDGAPVVRGGVEFSSTAKGLAHAVVELAQSLGGVARLTGPRRTKYQGGVGLPSWRVNVKLPPELTPFTLERKLTKWVRPTKYLPQRRIRSIEPDGREHSRCIRVAAKDSLYLTRSHIVTHNTISALTAIEHRMRAGQVQKTLIFGPLRVIHAVWEREARKWEHTKHLRFSVVHGPIKKREAALFRNADVYLCNYESMCWLAGMLDHYYLSRDKPLPFQMCVYDEVTKVKNSQSQRMKGGTRDIIVEKAKPGIPAVTRKEQVIGWRKIIDHFPFRTGLTGSPAANGYIDLFGQYLCIDGGERLGSFVSHYRTAYFKSDYMGWSYVPTEMGKQCIEEKIADITLKMDAADYLDMPAVKYNNVIVDMPAKAYEKYKEVENELYTRLDDGTEIELFNKASASNKCLQFANGTPYVSPESTEWKPLHDAKLDALEDIIEEAAGKPVLVAYSFKSDAARIMQRFKKLKPVNLTATPARGLEGLINKWNSGGVLLAIGHPASMGHGIDGLQQSGSIVVWFGLNYSLELTEQTNARINRQGQKNPVVIHRIMCRNTLDFAVLDALSRKVDNQTGLKDSIQRYRSGQVLTEVPSFL